MQALLEEQSGVVARRQLIAAGLGDPDIRRLVRNRRLVPVFRGVYVDHTGPLSWLNRAWAAVLYHEGSALCGRSALELGGHPIHVALPAGRKGARLPGVVLHQLRNLEARVQWNRSPPRLRIEEAVLDVAGAARTTSEAVAVVSDVIGRRATTPARVLAALEARGRSPRGVELRRILADAVAGSRSVLERAFLVSVERAHGLPAGSRQHRALAADGSALYRDVLYREWGVAVELDGVVWHSDSASRARDMTRDLDAVVSGITTIRLGWYQVCDDPCGTAARVARVLADRGWTGRPRACSPTCAVAVVSSFPVTS